MGINENPRAANGVGAKFDFLVNALAQAPTRNSKSVRKNPYANSLHVAVLIRLVQRYNAEWGYSATSEARIAEELNCSRSTVHRAVAKWRSLNLVEVVRPGGPHRAARITPIFTPVYRENHNAPLHREEQFRSSWKGGAECNERNGSEVNVMAGAGRGAPRQGAAAGRGRKGGDKTGQKKTTMDYLAEDPK